MGNFYVSHIVKIGDADKVARLLLDAGRAAVVVSTDNEWVCIFDRDSESQSAEDIVACGRLLSSGLTAPVLAVMNHDDSVLAYWLFQGGEVEDSYNSNPGYFDGANAPPAGGDARRLCVAFARPTEERTVARIIGGTMPFEIERHQQLADTLGLPSASIGAGFRDAEGGAIDGVSEEDFRFVNCG